jgi:hypothetical protein
MRFAIIAESRNVLDIFDGLAKSELQARFPQANIVPCTAEVLRGWIWDGTKFSDPAAVDSVPVEPTLQDLKLERLRELRAFVMQQIDRHIDKYPEPEREQFAVKEAEAKAYLDTLEPAAAPFLAIEAAAAGMELRDLASLVIRKAHFFREELARISGYRKLVESRIGAAVDPAELDFYLEEDYRGWT